MANVYRLGASGDVHAAIVSGDPDDPARPNSCNFDAPFTGDWSSERPEGPECYRCFATIGDGAAPAGMAAPKRSRRLKRKHVAIGGGAGALTLVGSLLASQGGLVPVNATFAPSQTGAAILQPSPHNPEPSPRVTAVPSPSVGPVSSLVPAPLTRIVRVIERSVERVFVVRAARPSPAPTPCPKHGPENGWCRFR